MPLETDQCTNTVRKQTHSSWGSSVDVDEELNDSQDEQAQRPSGDVANLARSTIE
jgi:hypothetical protein